MPTLHVLAGQSIIQGSHNLNADTSRFTKQIHLKTLLGLLFLVTLMQISSMIWCSCLRGEKAGRSRLLIRPVPLNTQLTLGLHSELSQPLSLGSPSSLSLTQKSNLALERLGNQELLNNPSQKNACPRTSTHKPPFSENQKQVYPVKGMHRFSFLTTNLRH